MYDVVSSCVSRNADLECEVCLVVKDVKKCALLIHILKPVDTRDSPTALGLVTIHECGFYYPPSSNEKQLQLYSTIQAQD